jgi:RimJ/RimL family protein N-acetyltransferase
MARGQGTAANCRPGAAPRTQTPLSLAPLRESEIPLVQSWFDTEAEAHLGDASLAELAFEEPGRLAYVACEQGQPVGLLIVEPLGSQGLVSMLVAPAARGAGVATRLLRAAQSEPAFAACERLIGGVDADNLASQQACLNAGFRFDGHLLPGEHSGRRFGFVWQRPSPAAEPVASSC